MAKKQPPSALTFTTRRLSDGRIRAEVRGGAAGVARNAANEIAREARANAPVKTGALRRKITAETTGRRAAAVRSDATYSRYQDEGAPRAGVRATRYFTRAVNNAKAREGKR